MFQDYLILPSIENVDNSTCAANSNVNDADYCRWSGWMEVPQIDLKPKSRKDELNEYSTGINNYNNATSSGCSTLSPRSVVDFGGEGAYWNIGSSDSYQEIGSTFSCTASFDDENRSECLSREPSSSSLSLQSHLGEERSKCSFVQPTTTDPWHELDRKRRLLVNFYHGATCSYSHYANKNGTTSSSDVKETVRYQRRGACPEHARCTAVRRLYDHVTHCSFSGNIDIQSNRCRVPTCRETRKVWRHYLYCNDTECLLCCIIPEATIRDPITLHKKSSPKDTSPRAGRPPLSPKRYVFCEEIEPI